MTPLEQLHRRLDQVGARLELDTDGGLQLWTPLTLDHYGDIVEEVEEHHDTLAELYRRFASPRLDSDVLH